jgi:hypothetical protein
MAVAVCRAVAAAVLGLAAAVAVAGAGVPNPNIVYPTYADLGACSLAGQPDPMVSFAVTLRDFGNFPVANSLVTCTFDADVTIYHAIPGTFDYCPCIEVFTDLNGVATFHVPGAGRNTNGGAGSTGASAARFGIGNCGGDVLLGTAHVTTFDENGGATTQGVEITDLAAWGADYNLRLTRPLRYRSDFNHSGVLDIVDLSYWGRVFNAGGSRFGYGALCP